MAWNAPMIHALLLKTPAPKAAVPLKVPMQNRPARSPSPKGVGASTTSGYKRG